MRMMVIAGLNLQKLHASRYESPVMVHIMTLVTITLKNLLRNPWFFVTKALLRAFVLPIRYESQTRKIVTSCNFPIFLYELLPD